MSTPSRRVLPLPVLMVLALGACSDLPFQNDDEADPEAIQNIVAQAEQILSGIDATTLTNLQNQPMYFSAQGDCAGKTGEQRRNCHPWLGLTKDGSIGRVPSRHRLQFSIEGVGTDGSFQFAAYPNCFKDSLLAAKSERELSSASESTDAADQRSEADANQDDEDTALTLTQPPRPQGSPGGMMPSSSSTDNRTKVQSHGGEKRTVNRDIRSCKKLIKVSTAGTPVTLVTPESGQGTTFRLRLDAQGSRPVFFSDQSCGDRCWLGIAMKDRQLVTEEYRPDQVALTGFWSSVSGSVSSGWDYVESGVSSVISQIGKTVTVDNLGGLDLEITDALPGYYFYSTTLADGVSAVPLSKGDLINGALYIQQGATYVGDGVVENAVAIGEYIVANICLLGVNTALSAVVGANAAQQEVAYQAALSAAAQAFATSIGTELIMSSPIGDLIRPISIALSVPLYGISSRYTISDWEDVISFIIASAIASQLEGSALKAGFTGFLISKLSEAVCLGLDQALSVGHSIRGAPAVEGLSDDCFENIRNNAIDRNENDYENICYALEQEITAAAAEATSSATSSTDGVFDNTGDEDEACPTDVQDESYLNLQESAGCRSTEFDVSGSDKITDVPVEPETELAWNTHWVGTTENEVFVGCGDDEVAVGMCSGGGSDSHCFDRAKEILCAGRSDVTLLSSETFDMLHHFEERVEQCPENYVLTEMCSSGSNAKCRFSTDDDNINLAFRCTKLASGFEIDYENCVDKESSEFSDVRLSATEVNHVIVGLCTSGNSRDCGEDSDKSKIARFCPLKVADTSDDPQVPISWDDDWTYNDTDAGFATCGSQELAVGLCAGGNSKTACFGRRKELMCGKPTADILDTGTISQKESSEEAITECDTNQVITSLCSTRGSDNDCRFASSGTKYRVAFECTALASGYTIDTSQCETIKARQWSARMIAPRSDYAMVGACASGSKKKCGDGIYRAAAKFCKITTQ